MISIITLGYSYSSSIHYMNLSVVTIYNELSLVLDRETDHNQQKVLRLLY